MLILTIKKVHKNFLKALHQAQMPVLASNSALRFLPTFSFSVDSKKKIVLSFFLWGGHDMY